MSALRPLRTITAVAALALAAAACGAGRSEPPPLPRVQGGVPGEPSYWLLVANEASDLVSRLVFTPSGGIRSVAEIEVGVLPADIDGVHGLRVGPGGREFYVSIAHGVPFGKLWKLSATADTLLGEAELGMFPATIAVRPDGRFAFVANFNLHGDPVPSSISVVYTPTMTEVTRVTTCIMPHGGRIDAAGARHYSVCMHSDQLVAIDTETFDLVGRMLLTPGQEGPLGLSEVGRHAPHAILDQPVCSPTWVTPGAGARASRFVYVACNRNAEVIEVDVRSWSVTRRFATGPGPYNLAVTPDGTRLLATLKPEREVVVLDLVQGRELARIETSAALPHGVVVSPDGRYAFVTNEAIGATPGTVDVIDLERLERVASVPVRYQPGGIDFWLMGQ